MKNIKKTPVVIISPSIRPLGLKQTYQTLLPQTYEDFIWLPRLSIGRPLKPDLCFQMNRALEEAEKYDPAVIISLQDHIHVPKNMIQTVLALHQEYKNAAITYPVGKVFNIDAFSEDDIRWDWRGKEIAEEKKINPKDLECKERTVQDYELEIDLASFDFAMLKKVKEKYGNYFEEEEDTGVVAIAGEERVIAAKLKMLGCQFVCSQRLKGVAFDHDAVAPNIHKGPHQEKNFEFWNRRRKEILNEKK